MVGVGCGVGFGVGMVVGVGAIVRVGRGVGVGAGTIVGVRIGMGTIVNVEAIVGVGGTALSDWPESLDPSHEKSNRENEIGRRIIRSGFVRMLESTLRS